jgi:adenosylcobinamide-GDP ribazoletransferase
MRSALAFLTVLGGAAGPDRRAPAWFAPVGALVGLAVGSVWWAAGEAWSPLVAAVLAVTADAVLTGLLHLDGLADTADGLLPPLERDRRLAVMSAPDVGAFGVSAVVLAVGLRVAALASLDPDPLLVAGLWATSRAAMALTLATVPYARARGLASAFGAAAESPAAPAPAALGLAGGGALTVGAAWWAPGLAAALGAAVGFAGVVGLARRRLGGFTGDVLGAAGVLGETVGLLLAAARW